MQMKTIDTVLRCDCLTEAKLTVIDKVPRALFDIVGWFYPLARPQISHSPLEVFGARQVRSSKFYSLRWPIYVFNSVVNTKLPDILSHQRSTTVSLETYSLYLGNLDLDPNEI